MPKSQGLRVLVHPDPLRLERELVEGVRGFRTGAAGAFDPILVLAASRRQVERARRTLAAELGALLAVEVLTHQALAYRLIESDPEAPRLALAPRSLLDVLVEGALAANPGSSLARYAADHPTAVRGIGSILRELREAGVTPADLRVPGDDTPRAAELGELLAAYERAVGDLETGAGFTDRAGLARRAVAAAARRAPYRAVFQIGAYELVGMNLDLARALPTREATVFLVPADPQAPAWRHALAFTRRHLGVEPEALDDGAGGAREFVRAARIFRGRGDRPAEASVDARLSLAHAQGPEAELNFAARRALKLVAGGVPPDEIGIVARTLEPYAALAETVFARHRLPVESSATLPLSRHPKARAFLLLLNALAGGFERQAVVDLLRSPYLRRPEGEGWRPDAWDRWSRKHRIVEGAGEWSEDLPAAIRGEEPPEWIRDDPDELRRFEERRRENAASAEVLAGAVRVWADARRRWDGCRSGAEHAARLRELAGRWIRRWGEPEEGDAAAAGRAVTRAVNDALKGALDDLELLDRLDHGSSERRFTVAAVREFLASAVEEAELPWPSTPGGVRFLDVMQARGLTFRHLFLIGFNADLMPRRPREDLFLSDTARRALREATGRPLAVRLEAREEEWLLFAQTVAAATESLTVTWQRADAGGKARTVSLFLRELARVLPGGPTLRDVLDGKVESPPERVPTHPTRAAAWLAGRTGLLSLEEGALWASDRPRGGAAALEAYLREIDPRASEALAPGIDLARTIERFHPEGPAAETLRYDGYLPAGSGWERPFSASSLESLGRCPQQFFFRYVLGARALDEAAEEFRFEARELGSSMHRVLERVLEDLGEAGLEALDPAGAVESGLAALERHFAEVLEPIARRVEPHFPVLYRNAVRVWRAELEAFLRADLARLAGEGHRLVGTELSWVGAVALGRGAALRNAGGDAAAMTVRGIPDRVTAGPGDTWLVSDYKTSGRLEKRIEPEEYLTGRRVQLPLYVLLAQAMGAPGPVAAELLGLGPFYLPDAGFARAGAVALPAGFETLRAGFEETLVLLGEIAREGRFPFNAGRHCDWCDFRPACRRHHYPSTERLQATGAYRDYFRIQRKSKTKATLAEVAAKDGEA
jgi:ATP-dependent helicase/nuclease subunit B